MPDDKRRLTDLYRAGELTDEEHRAAWDRSLGRHAASSNGRGGVAPPYAADGLRMLGTGTAIVVWVGVAFSVVALVTLGLAVLANLESEAAATQSSLATVATANAIYLLSSGLVGGWILVGGVLFVVWLYRMYAQTAAVSPARLTWRKGWTIAGWFVPGLNLYLPYRLTADVSRSINGVVHGSVGAWWGLLLLGAFVGRAASMIIDQPDPRLSGFYVVAAIEEVVYLCAGIAAALLVRQLTRGVVEASERVARLAPPSPASAAVDPGPSSLGR